MHRILVIDDSPSILAFVAESLREAGHQVQTAANGREAVAKLRLEPEELVVTDIYMPEEDGIEVIAATRKICPRTRMIAMSSKRGALSMFAAARALGAIQCLQKPFTREQLLAEVDRALNRQTNLVRPTADTKRLQG